MSSGFRNKCGKSCSLKWMRIGRSSWKLYLPAVAANPPRRWVKSLGQKPSADQLRCQLDAELATAFGSANDVTDAMKIRVIFKGVTYESLNDPNFVDIAAKAIPSLRFLHEEYDATKASSEPIGALRLLGRNAVPDHFSLI